MAGLDIVLRDDKGKIKQDIHISRDDKKGKIIEKDKLKKIEAKKK